MIITVACRKGGTSKTSTCAAIAQAMDYKGRKTLLVDLDLQGSASLIYGADEGGTGGSYSLIMGTARAEDLIIETPAGSIIPASKDLEGLDVELSTKPGRDFLLKAALEPIKDKYDCILIDTPPGYGTALVQALTACDLVIIPILCDPQALQGLHQVTGTIEDVKKYCNPALQIAAVVLTQYQARATLTRQYEALIKEQCQDMGLYLAETRIRRGIALQEAQACRANLYEYNKKSNPAADYMALCTELKLFRKTKKKGVRIGKDKY